MDQQRFKSSAFFQYLKVTNFRALIRDGRIPKPIHGNRWTIGFASFAGFGENLHLAGHEQNLGLAQNALR